MTDEITLDAPETRIERFLAAAAGVEGITLDEPETRIERYLYMIAQGSGGVPTVEDADKGKYLHANESTGALEWAEGGGSGGGANNIVYVDYTYEEANNAKTWTLTKTAGELLSLLKSGKIVFIQIDADEYYQLAGIQQLGANSTNFQFPCIDPNPISQSNLTYPKITYKKSYQATGLTAYPVVSVNSGGGND